MAGDGNIVPDNQETPWPQGVFNPNNLQDDPQYLAQKLKIPPDIAASLPLNVLQQMALAPSYKEGQMIPSRPTGAAGFGEPLHDPAGQASVDQFADIMGYAQAANKAPIQTYNEAAGANLIEWENPQLGLKKGGVVGPQHAPVSTAEYAAWKLWLHHALKRRYGLAHALRVIKRIP